MAASWPDIPLADGQLIPLLGLGTWRLAGDGAYRAVRHALDVGYRHLDTATAYGNEREVGRAVRDSGIDRAQLFLTTKLPPDDAGRAGAVLDASLRALDVDHVDLWLIHWPPEGTASPSTWQELVRAREEGRATSIGVSNYSVEQLDELTRATGVTPAVNQVPWSPLRHDPGVLAAHESRSVVLEGYSPLRHGTLDDPTIGAVAAELGVSPARVILRWHVEHSIVAIPKSAQPSRIEENADIADLELSEDQMARLDALGQR